MDDSVSPPEPDETSLLKMVARDVAMPNGRVMRLKMSAWHWDMIAFLELWNDHFNRKHGLLHTFYERTPNLTDTDFAVVVMQLIRNTYEVILREFPDGEPPVYRNPLA